MKVCEEALKAGKSACVDNTNPTPEVRARYLDIAKRLKIPARCFYFDVPKDICMHNNTQRAVNTHRKHLSKKIAAVPIHSFFKNHVKPTLKEGFEEIKVVNFVPGPFENEEDEKAYYSLT
jgi:bifunctional polynucleotide phosphatase/kinase